MSTNISTDFAVRHKQVSDEELLSAAKSGDRQAFAELCLQYRGMLMRRIFRIVQHREDAEDTLQETFLSAYLHLNSFRGTCRFSTWVMRIGINASMMLLRKRRRLLNAASELVTDDGQRLERLEFRDPRPDPEQRYITCQTGQILNRAIQRLPSSVRTITDMCYRREYRLKEAAEILGMNESTAKSKMLRARRRLSRALKSQCGLARREQ